MPPLSASAPAAERPDVIMVRFVANISPFPIRSYRR
jgi:hypothetical protein